MAAPSDPEAVQVDDLDLRIIGALQIDGRRPVADIARDLNVPKSTVQRRLDTLIRDRVIMIAAYADSAKLGLDMHAHLNVKVDLVHYQDVIDAIATLTEVRWLAVTTGPSDIVAEAYFASATHLHEFIRDKLAGIPGIRAVETSVILSVEKITFHWDALLREAARHRYPHVRLSTPANSYARSRLQGNADMPIGTPFDSERADSESSVIEVSSTNSQNPDGRAMRRR